MPVSSSPPPAPRKRQPATPRPPREGAEWLAPAEAAHVLGRSTTTLARWRLMGTGPAFHRPRPRMVRYNVEAIRRWMAAPVNSTTEADSRSENGR